MNRLAHARRMLAVAALRLKRAKIDEEKWHLRVSAMERRLAAAQDARDDRERRRP